MKRDAGLAFLNEVSSVPLQQALRHQHAAFQAFFGRDVSAERNILAAGQAVTACGADVRHYGASRVQSAVKQEPRSATAGIPVPQGGE
jgi:hypothetical protein